MQARRGLKNGFTLVETLVGAFVFMVIALGVYQGYVTVIRLAEVARAKSEASLLAAEQQELVRNLPYQSVGVVGGIPSGVVPKNQTLVRGGLTFLATTTIRNIDDPFDGLIGAAPNDSAPADYKLVQFEIDCPACRNFNPVSFSTTVAPKNVENSTGNGALFVNVLDANGQPVSSANVHIVNNQVAPAIVVDDVTGVTGNLQLVDVPPGSFAYEVTVSKGGYSTARTYPTTDPENPNPVNPHATVVANQVTSLTLAIDRVGTLDLQTTNASCQPIATVPLHLDGAKLIGTSPDILKYQGDTSTDGSGAKSLTGLEWDTYQFTITGGSYDLAGAVPLLPVGLTPGADQAVKLFVRARDPKALLVTVKDAATGLPLSGADVTLSKTGFSQLLTTERGFFNQTDWSGGGGQTDFVNADQFLSEDGNIDWSSSAGDLRLRAVFGGYAPAGELSASSFDIGTSTQSTFYQFNWTPLSQATSTGANPVRGQLASGNDAATTTWNYLGPDGTAVTYYTTTSSDVNAIHNSDRYIRYKLFLTTDDTNATPLVSDVALTYGSGCLPFGQVFFHGLSGVTYTLAVSKTGYQTYTNPSVVIGKDWQTVEVLLGPA